MPTISFTNQLERFLPAPTVEVEVNYPGANARTVEESIASAIEAEVNGAENMIYFSSKSSRITL